MYIDGTFGPFILSLLILPLSNVMLFINTLYEIYDFICKVLNDC